MRENIRFAVKREAGGEEGVLQACIEHYFKPGHRDGILADLNRLVISAQQEK